MATVPVDQDAAAAQQAPAANGANGAAPEGAAAPQRRGIAPVAARPARKSRLSAGGSELLLSIERYAHVTASGLILLFFVFAGLIVGHFISSRALLLLVYGVIIVGIAAFMLGRRRLAVQARRSDLPGRVREGQLVDVELELTARRGVSTIVLEEELAEQLGQTVRVPVPSLPGGHAVQHHYSFSPKLRGVYEVGPLTAVWSDPFGLTRHRMTLMKPTRLIVHPVVEQVQDRVISREWEDPPIRPPVSKPWPTGFEFYSMRDYVSGDDPRRIVWRATAKVLDTMTGIGRYLVRESEQGITDHVTVILDTDKESHSPGEPSETFETAVRAAASLGVRHLRDGMTVTLEINSDKAASDLRGRRSEIFLLDSLAAVKREEHKLTRSMDRMLTGGRRNQHYVIITPYLSQRSASRLRLMLERGTSMLLTIVVSEDTDPLVVHRAGSLGCNVVELRAGAPMDRAFQRVSGMARR